MLKKLRIQKRIRREKKEIEGGVEEREGFDGIQDMLSSKSRSRESVEGAGAGGDAYGFYRDVPTGEGFSFSKYQNQEQKQQSYLVCGLLGHHSINILPPQLQTSLDGLEKLDEIPAVTQDGLEPWKENQNPFSLASSFLVIGDSTVKE
ncbi:hypothetical protein SADUNF_Sadunf10G0109500 [Salix dunnii]|uniref:Uncharacterized protein n=1 Tax=Salix dunnii TaxID=1413687 RepID=A0A835JS84_9ROSI|nr:hypothetical protein SADUNF_Sadunf10G0109500 [Salix dunnii]